jgi:hypothetical protein
LRTNKKFEAEVQKLVDEIAKSFEYAGRPETVQRVLKELSAVFEEKKELFERKQRSYGPTNISKWGELGVLVRSSDKVERLANMIFYQNPNPLNDESEEDTWSDICVYAAIALIIRRGKWSFIENPEHHQRGRWFNFYDVKRTYSKKESSRRGKTARLLEAKRNKGSG